MLCKEVHNILTASYAGVLGTGLGSQEWEQGVMQDLEMMAAGSRGTLWKCEKGMYFSCPESQMIGFVARFMWNMREPS